MMDEPTSIDGCFETMLYHDGKVFLADAHFERLGRSLDFLEWPMPDGLTLNAIENEIVKNRNEQDIAEEDRLRCRLTISREIGSNKTDWRLDVTIQIHPSPHFKLLTVNLHDPVFFGTARRCKLTSRDRYFEALNYAKKLGFDDALLTIEDGFVSESCIANILWVKEDVFYTPNPTSGQLLGLGIEYFSNVLDSNGYSIVPGKFKVDSVLDSDMAWILNSVRGPIPIEKIDDQEIPVIGLISELIDELFWRNIP